MREVVYKKHFKKDYQRTDELLVLIRTGTHCELFK